MFDWLKDSGQFMLKHWGPMLSIIVPIALVKQYLLSRIPFDSVFQLGTREVDLATLEQFFADFWATFFLISLLTLGQTVMLILAMTQLLGGYSFKLAKVLSRTLVVFIPVFFLNFVSGLGISVGLLLLIVPGVYVMFKWTLAPYFMLVDGTRLFASLGHSWRLTKGYVGELFGGMVIILILSSVPTWFYSLNGTGTALINNMLEIVSACIQASLVIYLYRVFDYAKANPRNL